MTILHISDIIITTTLQDIQFFKKIGYSDISILEAYIFDAHYPKDMVNLAEYFTTLKKSEDELGKYFVKKLALLGLGKMSNKL